MPKQTPSRRAANPPLHLRLTLARLIPAVALTLAALLHVTAARGADLTRAMAATLVVYTDDMDEAFLGSAFLWAEGMVAVTNAHVVRDVQQVELRTQAGMRLTAQVIVRDESRDIALIAVPGAGLGAGLRPADAAPAIGQPVYALGAPLGAEFSASQGMISALGRQVQAAQPVRYVQHDAAVNPGSSGGPLVDGDGRLVGMNSLIADGSRMFVGIGYAIPAADLARLIPMLLDGSLREVPELGLRLRPVTRKIAAALHIADTGLLVDHVAAGGIAERGGLRPGDVVLAMEGAVLAQAGDLALAIEARASDHPGLTVVRAGAILRLALDLSPRRPVLAKMAAGAVAGRIGSYSLAGLGISRDGDRVTGLTPGSPGAFAGLAPGDRILALDGWPVETADLDGRRITGPLLLLVRRATGETLHIVIDPWSKGRGAHPVGGANVLDPAVVLF